MSSELTPAELVERAKHAQSRAFAPVSGYRVGAAIIAEDGSVWEGCNVEHVVLPETVCAEKTALVKAISEGHRRFTACAVYTDSEPPASPCGSCRQMLHAWGVTDVYMANGAGVRHITVAELLPLAFDLDLGAKR
jgi:cytidine deaminase